MESPLLIGLKEFLDANAGDLDWTHLEKTPQRVVRAYAAMVEGLNTSPRDILDTAFACVGKPQMVHRRGVRVMSTCAHHLLPFVGKAHFAYLPKERIVGISKISRLVRCLSRRLQYQEKLSDEIVDHFQEIVRPWGCGVYIKAYHFCEIARGVEERAATTETTALRGKFLTSKEVRREFLSSIDYQEIVFP